MYHIRCHFPDGTAVEYQADEIATTLDGALTSEQVAAGVRYTDSVPLTLQLIRRTKDQSEVESVWINPAHFALVAVSERHEEPPPEFGNWRFSSAWTILRRHSSPEYIAQMDAPNCATIPEGEPGDGCPTCQLLIETMEDIRHKMMSRGFD